MTGPKKPRSPLETTAANPVLTEALASRVRRDVALEKATEESHGTADDSGQIPVTVVLGPDGTPEVVDEAEPPPAPAQKRRD